ncbi:MAG: small ribosomal subunit Rsm22 family protein [Sumerlaeia bacterium]
MHELPFALAQAIEDLARQYPPPLVAAAAKELSDRYREKGLAPSSVMETEAHRIAYAVTRMPATYAAIARVLEETLLRLPEFEPASLLDLGAGPGTAAWAVSQVFGQTVESVRLIERDADLADFGRELMEETVDPALRGAEREASDLTLREAYPTTDLVTICYALGEIPHRFRPDVISAAWAATAQDGCLIVVEAGTPEGYAVVIEARDYLIANGAKVAAPCPGEIACPMAGTTSWCHFPERLARSKRHRLMKGASVGYEDEKFSFAVLTRRGDIERPGARVVDRPKTHKAAVELPLCAPPGLVQLQVDRRAKDAYKMAKKARWGDTWAMPEEAEGTAS